MKRRTWFDEQDSSDLLEINSTQRSLKVKIFSLQQQLWIGFLLNLSKYFVVWENLSSHYSEISLTEAVTSRQSTIHLWQSAAKLA